jgi:hypothetical protein
MRITSCFLGVFLLLVGGCRPNEENLPGDTDRDTRPGAAQEDTGTDRSPAGSGSENVAPPVRPSPNPPGSPTTPPG